MNGESVSVTHKDEAYCLKGKHDATQHNVRRDGTSNEMKMDESEMKRKGKSEGGNGQIEYSENKCEGENANASRPRLPLLKPPCVLWCFVALRGVTISARQISVQTRPGLFLSRDSSSSCQWWIHTNPVKEAGREERERVRFYVRFGLQKTRQGGDLSPGSASVSLEIYSSRSFDRIGVARASLGGTLKEMLCCANIKHYFWLKNIREFS